MYQQNFEDEEPQGNERPQRRSRGRTSRRWKRTLQGYVYDAEKANALAHFAAVLAQAQPRLSHAKPLQAKPRAGRAARKAADARPGEPGAPGEPEAKASATGSPQPADVVEPVEPDDAGKSIRPLPSRRASGTEMPLQAENGGDSDSDGSSTVKGAHSRIIKAEMPFIGIDQSGPNAAIFLFARPTREQMGLAMNACLDRMAGDGRAPKKPKSWGGGAPLESAIDLTAAIVNR